MPLGLGGTEAKLGAGRDRVAEFLGQFDQAAQQVLQLVDGDAADRLGAGHLRQQEAHLGVVVFRFAQSQQGLERGQDIPRQRRDAVHRGRGVPGQQAVAAQAVQHRLQALGDQVGQLLVDVGARERRAGGIAGQFAQDEQTHQHAILGAVEQGREGRQHRLGTLEVEDLLDFVGSDAFLEVCLQRIKFRR